MAMLKNKHITLSIILVCLLVVSPMAKAQLGLGGSGGSGGSSGSGGLLGGILGGSGGSGGLLGGILGGSGGSGGLLGGILGGSGGSGGLLGGILGATGGLLGGLNKANIQGVLFCTLNGSLSLDTAASTPVFPNADIQLQCGKQNTVVSSTTTTAAGIFSIPPNTIQMLFSTLLSECNLAVKTPLSSCNVTLPSIGNLVSPLTVVGSTVSRVGNVINLSPAGFLLTG